MAYFEKVGKGVHLELVSTMTVWLIIIAVVALAVGPVMMFQPNASERRLARLRQRAAELKMRVSLMHGKSPELEHTACYSCYWRHKSLTGQYWQLLRKGFAHGIHLADVWSWEGEPATSDLHPVIEQFLKELPDTVQALIASPQGLGVAWRERGDVEQVELINEKILSLQEKLAKR